MKYTWINARAYTLSRIALFVISAIDHEDPADHEAVPDFMGIMVEQLDALVTAAHCSDDFTALVDAAALTKTAAKLYKPDCSDDVRDTVASLLYQIEGLLVEASTEDYTGAGGQPT